MKSGNYCVEAIQEVTKYAENASLGPDRINFQKQFNAEQLNTR